MAITFKNAVYAGVDATYVTVYTCPALTTAIVFGLSIANIYAGAITAQARVRDTSASVSSSIIAVATPIAQAASLVLAGGVQKIVLEAGDYIEVKTSQTDGADVVVSVLEIS